MIVRYVTVWEDSEGNRFFFPEQTEIFEHRYQALSYQVNSMEMMESLYDVKPSGTWEIATEDVESNEWVAKGTVVFFGENRAVMAVAGPLYDEMMVIH